MKEPDERRADDQAEIDRAFLPILVAEELVPISDTAAIEHL